MYSPAIAPTYDRQEVDCGAYPAAKTKTYCATVFCLGMKRRNCGVAIYERQPYRNRLSVASSLSRLGSLHARLLGIYLAGISCRRALMQLCLLWCHENTAATSRINRSQSVDRQHCHPVILVYGSTAVLTDQTVRKFVLVSLTFVLLSFSSCFHVVYSFLTQLQVLVGSQLDGRR